MRWLLAAAVATLALALAAPTVAAPKKPKPPPPPPPDTAADCTFTAQADVPDYLVLATLILGVDCATVKQDHRHRHRVHEGRGFPSADPVQHGHVLEHDDVHLQDRPLLVRQPSGRVPRRPALLRQRLRARRRTHARTGRRLRGRPAPLTG